MAAAGPPDRADAHDAGRDGGRRRGVARPVAERDRPRGAPRHRDPRRPRPVDPACALERAGARLDGQLVAVGVRGCLHGVVRPDGGRPPARHLQPRARCAVPARVRGDRSRRRLAAAQGARAAPERPRRAPRELRPAVAARRRGAADRACPCSNGGRWQRPPDRGHGDRSRSDGRLRLPVDVRRALADPGPAHPVATVWATERRDLPAADRRVAVRGHRRGRRLRRGRDPGPGRSHRGRAGADPWLGSPRGQGRPPRRHRRDPHRLSRGDLRPPVAVVAAVRGPGARPPRGRARRALCAIHRTRGSTPAGGSRCPRRPHRDGDRPADRSRERRERQHVQPVGDRDRRRDRRRRARDGPTAGCAGLRSDAGGPHRGGLGDRAASHQLRRAWPRVRRQLRGTGRLLRRLAGCCARRGRRRCIPGRAAPPRRATGAAGRQEATGQEEAAARRHPRAAAR